MISQGAVVNGKSFKSAAKAIALAFALSASAGTLALAADMPVKAAPKPTPAPPFFFVNDTSVSFTYWFDYSDPGVSGSSATVPGGVFGQKNKFGMAQGEMDHFDVWQYGVTLIHMELNQYAKADPIGGDPGANGSREFFGFAQETFGLNALTNSKAFTTPFTNDVGILVRLTAGTQNHFLDEETTQYAAGVNFDFALPKILGGSFQAAITAYKEHTNNEFNACGNAGFGVAVNGACTPGFGPFSGERDFEWTWKIFTFYALPLGPLLGTWADAARIVNILSVTGPKGTGISNTQCLALGCFGPGGAFNSNESKTEVFEDARLSFDTSKLFWGKPGIWDTYVGFRYWLNMYGTNHNAFLFSTIAPGTSIMESAYVGMTYHFK